MYYFFLLSVVFIHSLTTPWHWCSSTVESNRIKVEPNRSTIRIRIFLRNATWHVPIFLSCSSAVHTFFSFVITSSTLLYPFLCSCPLYIVFFSMPTPWNVPMPLFTLCDVHTLFSPVLPRSFSHFMLCANSLLFLATHAFAHFHTLFLFLRCTYVSSPRAPSPRALKRVYIG